LIAALVAAATLYCAGARRMARSLRGVGRHPVRSPRVERHPVRWPLWRTASFIAGLSMLALALLSGVDGYSERMLSVHMTQHLLLGLLAPALLLYGAPLRLALRSSPRARGAAARLLGHPAVTVLTKPAVGFALFACVVLATHLTGLYELALEHPLVHELEHLALFWSGVLLLAPLIASDPLPHPPGAIARFSWLMGAMGAMAIPGALLTFATSVRYPYYLAPARATGRSALSDQHLAGAIMWVGGGIFMFLLALTIAMQAMLAEERRQRRRELYPQRSGVKRSDKTGVLGA
jgi:putative membrane protein